MFRERIDRETPELHDEGVRMRFIGRRDGIDPELMERMEWAEELTAANDRITVLRRLQLRRAGGDPRRRQAVRGWRRG